MSLVFNLASHLMTQLRVVIWKQWKVRAKRVWSIRKLGGAEWAVQEAGRNRKPLLHGRTPPAYDEDNIKRTTPPEETRHSA